ncbi:DUF4145 domain-containing protein [Ralstonia pickettii]|uniref:DUF4145 domain-containing protein n=1 Tax=Ralstonia pickettii TaxID=329 RepID=UPI00271495D4|nr:DUF4145 domain-containing protein [Ralstonia pickettii]WKZ86307.1 DUF4145 domain-containing protein [Ralstonia pickettii]
MTVVYKNENGPADDRLVYVLECKSCKLPTTILTDRWLNIVAVWPELRSTYSSDIPARARARLKDARDTLANPSPSIVSSAAAVDFMLKAKGLKDGSLFTRIEQAAEQHMITDDMKAWAHEIRDSSNFERHADETAEEPTKEEAQRCLKFAEAIAELWFELPARVARGRLVGKAEPAKPDLADFEAERLREKAAQSLKQIR